MTNNVVNMVKTGIRVQSCCCTITRASTSPRAARCCTPNQTKWIMAKWADVITAPDRTLWNRCLHAQLQRCLRQFEPIILIWFTKQKVLCLFGFWTSARYTCWFPGAEHKYELYLLHTGVGVLHTGVGGPAGPAMCLEYLRTTPLPRGLCVVRLLNN